MYHAALTDGKKQFIGYMLAGFGFMWVFWSLASSEVFLAYGYGMLATIVYVAYDRARHSETSVSRRGKLSQYQRKQHMMRIFGIWLLAVLGLLVYGATVEGAANQVVLAVLGYLHMTLACWLFWNSINPEPQKHAANEVG